MTLRDLQVGDFFRFTPGGAVWEYRGNCWYGSPFSGGPYARPENPHVIPCDSQGHTLPWIELENADQQCGPNAV